MDAESLRGCDSGQDRSGEVLFRWNHKEIQATSVSISGSWCEWRETKPLSEERDVFGRGKLFSGTVRLPLGKHLFRFIVDGEWVHNTQLLSERGEGAANGKLCNVVEVTADSPFRLQLPMKSAPGQSAEDLELINSLREYGLRTGTGSSNNAKPSVENDTEPRSSAYTSASAGSIGSNSAAAAAAAAAKKECAEVGAYAATASDGIVLKTRGGKGGGENGIKPSSTACGDTAPGERCYEGSGGGQGLGYDIGVDADALGIGVAGSGASSELVTGSREAREQAVKKLSSASATYRRQQASAAVGACLVTSSVRKDGKLLVAMVGMPARGKTFVARTIARHLNWVGLRCRIFSLGEHRRKEVGVWQPISYFEPGGQGEKTRKRIAGQVLDEALEALRSDIDIAVYDGSNVTRDRRKWLSEAVASSGLHAQVVFIESICHDEELIERNIGEFKRSSPEYEEKKDDEAEQQYKDRITEYQRIYQPLEASEGHKFIKLIDVGSQMVTNLISGYIPGRITLLCLNLHLDPRPIWMSRHGESEFNMQGRIGGDAPLTAAGKMYAVKLTEFMKRRYPTNSHSGVSGHAQGGGELAVWTSTMLRTGQTVAPMNKDREVIKWSQLSEINAGLMDSLTYEHVAAEMPQEYEARQKDKLCYRYPGGESYQDLFTRLEPVLFEMLRQRSPLLVVGHQAILRVLYGYFTGKRPAECPTLNMPLHTAIKLTPKAYMCEEEWYLPLEEGDYITDTKDINSDAHHA